MKSLFLFLTILICLPFVSCSDDDDDAKDIKLTSSAVDTHSATINFDAVEGATAYLMTYEEKNAEDGDINDPIEISAYDADGNVIDGKYTLEDLKAGSEYDVEVQAISVKVNIDDNASVAEVLAATLEATANAKSIAKGNVTITTKASLAGLVKTWSSDDFGTYQFDADGYGKYTTNSEIERTIRWYANETILTITTYYSQIGGTYTTEEYEYNINDEGTITFDDTTYSPVTE